MATGTRDDARKTVERAQRESSRQERERTAKSAKRTAGERVKQLQRRTGVRRFLFENGLSLAAFALFACSFVGQVVAGHHEYNEEQRSHAEAPIAIGAYLRSGAFLEATAENWESEFLQMGLFVLLTAFLYQRGSSESKRLEEPEAVDQDPREARDDADAPWPVRHGGLPLAFYKHSLSIALLVLFVVSFTVHAIGGAMAYNEDQQQHGGAAVTVLGYLATSRFWFESFQNWQSEFFSVGARRASDPRRPGVAVIPSEASSGAAVEESRSSRQAGRSTVVPMR
jgi:hypothetical protein